MIAKLVLPPSFYMWASWVFTLALYMYEPIAILPLEQATLATIFYVVLISFLSSAVFARPYHAALTDMQIQKDATTGFGSFFFFSALGFIGLITYLQYCLEIVGGLDAYFYLFLNNPLELRALAISELGGAIQLTYFSWVAIGIGIYIVFGTKTSPWLRLGIFLVTMAEFGLNLTFIDRTRPIWLLVILAISFAMTRKHPAKFLFKFAVFAPLLFVSLFLTFSILTGKLFTESSFDTLWQYILGGFAYLNYLIANVTQFDNSPIRSFYPIAKIFEAIGLLDQVPSQILEFYAVPFPTNIGTFVEPLYSDGGLVFLLIGIPVVIVGFDWIGMRALQSRRLFGVMLYANFVFANLISFFVSKFASVPTYLFAILFVLSLLVPRRGLKPVIRGGMKVESRNMPMRWK